MTALEVVEAEKIYPTVEELIITTNGVTCPQCSAIFKSDSQLNLHLSKTHKQDHLLQPNDRVKNYHCPDTECRYHKTTCFNKLKSLRQHFMKVHHDKKHTCPTCRKGFATESFRDRHREYCDVTFTCCECEAFYGSYETLITHARRKSHKILDKSAYKDGGPPNKIRRTNNGASFSSPGVARNRFILPKASSSAGTLDRSATTVASPSKMADSSSQTECMARSRSSLSLGNSRETQTDWERYFTVETQTIGDYFKTTPKGPMLTSKSTTNTQTGSQEPHLVAPKPRHASCNTSFTLEDDLELTGLAQTNSSTQTCVGRDDEGTATRDTAHTETTDLLSTTLDSNYFNTMHMETQTDFMFNNEEEDELFNFYTSHMCTQTCEELLLGEIGLSDMHTQTVFDDVLRSVESQTVMSRRIPLGCKQDMSHMETQTEVAEFKQILEEINA